jgi:plastocyanin
MRLGTTLFSTMLTVALLAGGGVARAVTADATVGIDNFTFTPSALVVTAGTKVVWTNRDDIPHTITDASESRAFKSAALDSDDSFSYVFSRPGTYSYFSSLHPHMRGTVVVK